MKNIKIQSLERAVIIDDVYEGVFEKLTLKDDTKNAPILILGKHSGALVFPDFPVENIEYGDGLTKKVIIDEMPVQVW